MELVRQIAARWPGRVAVGLDHRDGEVQVRGWTAGGGRRVVDLVPEAMAAGAAAVIVTDIARDGRLAGPDVDGLSALLAQTGAPIIASGGVRDLEDVRALARLGLAGVIAGKAIYEGRLDVAAYIGSAPGAISRGFVPSTSRRSRPPRSWEGPRSGARRSGRAS